jgi:ABC-type transport system involved in multi-copper enzyme maturation permease subunit
VTSGVRAIVGYAMGEALRRRVFLVVLILTAVSGALYVAGAAQAFHEAASFGGDDFGVDSHDLVGATVFGLAMFAILFLGAVLAIFLTLSVVRGDAERGLLQPLVVRPIGRAQLLLARFGGAAAVTFAYVAAIFLACVAATSAVGSWSPDHIVVPALELCLAALILCALSLLGSVFLSATANGIAIFMVYGAGLTAGFLGQVGHAIGSGTLERISRLAEWALPFQALYQDALHEIAADTGGATGFALRLGPFGGSQESGPLLWAWAAAYLVVVGAVAVRAFGRRDL